MREALRAFCFLLLGVFVGCGSDDDGGGGSCTVGSEACPCTSGGGCDPGLTCLSDTCVNAGGDSDVDSDADTDADSDADSDSDASCAATCLGCCNGETCEGGATIEACGVEGAPCTSCDAVDICAMGACAIDRDHTWTLRAIRAASVPAGDPGYESCDAFVSIRIGAESGQTDPDDLSLAPEWNQDLLTSAASLFLDDELQIFVVDSDAVNGVPPDEEVGACTRQISEADLRAGGFTIDSCDDNGGYNGVFVTDLELELNPS